MDPVERVLWLLSSQRDHLRIELDQELEDIRMHILPGGKKAEKNARARYQNRLEAISYAINKLQDAKEESCPD